MLHGRYSNCRLQNFARYNRTICQRVENTSFRERLSCILHAFAKGYQGYKSNLGFHVPFDPGGGTLGISGWGCAAGTLEPLTYTELAQLNFATLY